MNNQELVQDVRNFGCIFGTNLPPVEPEQQCEACQAQGTVARILRTDGVSQVLEMHRFCESCWPEQRARYQARWAEEARRNYDAYMRSGRDGQPPQRGGETIEDGTWHLMLEILKDFRELLGSNHLPPRAELIAIAKEVRAKAHEVTGEMPWAVEEFLREYEDADTLTDEERTGEFDQSDDSSGAHEDEPMDEGIDGIAARFNRVLAEFDRSLATDPNSLFAHFNATKDEVAEMIALTKRDLEVERAAEAAAEARVMDSTALGKSFAARHAFESGQAHHDRAMQLEANLQELESMYTARNTA